MAVSAEENFADSEVPLPVIAEDKFLVGSESCGVCERDVPNTRGTVPPAQYPSSARLKSIGSFPKRVAASKEPLLKIGELEHVFAGFVLKGEKA